MPTPDDTGPRDFRVLVPKADGTGHEFVAATESQYWAYMRNDPRWRSAKPDTAPSVVERIWHRIAGRRTP